MLRALAVFLTVFLSCTAELVAAAAAPPVPPTMRLGDAVRPVSYDAELTVTPNQERLLGRIAITLDLTEPTNFFWLNASRLDLKKVTLTIGTRVFPGKVTPSSHDFVGVRFTQMLPPRRAVLNIEYEGAIDRADTEGLFRARDGDNWYAFSNFEPIAARRVFPCFDEPVWKTPWKLSLIVPAADLAIANAPAIGEDLLPGNLKRVRFAATPPLPSYLIAFAVGPFEIVDLGQAGRKATTLRLFVPHGRVAEARFAQRATPRILETIEDYVGSSYPFDKLDLVAVPVASGFSAMQSPGLIAFKADTILAKSDEESSAFQRVYVDHVSHEISEQWFGDLRTLQWWDEAWISEGLAAWMSGKVTQRFDPEWMTRLALDRQRQDAVEIDRLVSSRPLRQAVETNEDLISASDQITASKGAAVLRMFETWLGEDRFRSGVRAYLAANPPGNARSEDFLAALAGESGDEQSALGPAFRSMIDSAGVPELDVVLVCPPAGKGAPRLELTQARYAPALHLLAPSPLQASGAANSYVFPACFQYGEGGDFGEECVVVRDAHQALPLPDGENCPDWVVANRDGTSYLVPVLKDNLAARLEHAPLLPDEAVAVIGDARILSASKDLPFDRVLALAARFAANRQPPVALAALNLLNTTVPSVLLGAAQDRDAFARYVKLTFGARAAALGWLPKPGEREVDGFLRQDLLPFVADRGSDLTLRNEADQLAREWLAGKTNLGAMLGPILITAARFGSSDLFEGYVAAADRSTGRERSALYTALGAFRDPQLLNQALALALSDPVEARDAWAGFVEAGSDPLTTPFVLRFVTEHYDVLMKRLPDLASEQFARFGARLCDPNARRDFEIFFGDPTRRALEGSRVYLQSLETVDLCLANHDSQVQSLRAALSASRYKN